MSTITALGFDITSTWDGRGVRAAKGDLDSLKASIDAVNSKDVRVSVDDAGAKTSLDDLKAELDALGSMHATATADVDAKKALLDDLKAELDQFADEHKTATADVDARTAQLDELKAKLAAFGMTHETAKVDVDADSARSGLRGLTQDSEDASRGLGDLGGAAGGASGGLGGVGGAASGAGGGVGIFYAAIAVLIALLVALLPALGGLMTGLIGIGAGAGVAALALKPVIQAVQDFGAAQQQGGAQAAQYAATQQANATAVANAQQAIVQAQQQAAQTAITSAASIVSAQISVKNAVLSVESAQRAQAMTAAQSANSLISAEQGVTNAQIAEATATQALTQARIDAKNAMDNLNNSVADAGLSVRSAQLQVQQAQQNLNSLGVNATPLQRAQAQLALDQAKQSVIDQTTRLKQLTQQQTASNKAGVEGSNLVVAAKNAERTAVMNVANTERALSMARLTAANSAVNAAAQVKRAEDNLAQAEGALARAREAASFSNQQAAQRVVQAQQALNNLLVQQKLTMAATAAASPYGKFAQDMARLSGPGRDLVNMLTRQKGLLQDMSLLAQNSFLPGFNRFVGDAISSLPTLDRLISTFGRGFGDFMAKLGDWAASPMAQGQFNAVIKAAAGFMQDLGDATLRLAPAFTAFLAASGPATAAFGQGLGEIIGTGLPDMFRAMTPYIASGAQFLKGFLGLVSDLLPIIGLLGGLMTQVLGPAMQPLRDLVNAVAGALAPALQQLVPVLGQFAAAFITDLVPLLHALAPVFMMISTGLAGIMNWLQPMLPLLAPLAAGFWLVNVAMDANPVMLIILGLGLLVGAILLLVKHLDVVKRIWGEAWDTMKSAFDAFTGWFKTGWDGLWRWAKNTVDVNWAQIRADWSSSLDSVRHAFDSFISGIKGAWNAGWSWVKTTSADIWGHITDGWNSSLNGIRHAFDSFMSGIKGAWNAGWSWVKTTSADIWGHITDGWNAFSKGIGDGVSSLVNGVRTVWSTIVDIFKTPINAVIGIWNTVGGVLGLPHINPVGGSPAQTNTGGGGNSLGAGGGGLAKRGFAGGGHITGPGTGTSDSIAAWLSNGEFVMPAHVVQHYGVGTMEDMRAKRFASGGLATHDGAPGFWGGGLVGFGKSLIQDAGSVVSKGLSALKDVAATVAYDTAKPLLDKVIALVPHPIPGLQSPFGDLPYDVAKSIENAMLGRLKSSQDAAKNAGNAIAGAAGAASTIPIGNHKAIIDAALKAAGVPTSAWPKWESGMNTLITRESGWNPAAVNRTDSNAKAGHPSQGLAQTIPSTFAAYHAAGTSNNILDPVANVAAAIRYIMARYGDISAVQQANPSLPPKGYALGTASAQRGWAIVGERGPEAVHFGGGESVKSFTETMAAIGGGGANMKALAAAIDRIADGGSGGDINLSMPITITGVSTDTATDLADKLEADLIPKLNMLLTQRVGSKS